MDKAISLPPSTVDWNAGTTGLEAWLAQSVMPTNEPPSVEQDELQQDAQQRQRELQDLQSLQKVHFVALAPETRPLTLSIPQYRKMPLEAQIYLRKIANIFPALPMNLAERFAKSSVTQRSRLRGLRTLDESPVKEPEISVYDEEQLGDVKSAGTRRSRFDVPEDEQGLGLLPTTKRKEMLAEYDDRLI